MVAASESAAEVEVNEKQFAVVELMGHRKFGAEVSEVERFGTKMLQARILGPDVVQLVHPQAIYAVTACTEEQARRVNTEWVLRQAAPVLELAAPVLELAAEIRAKLETAEGESE